MKAPKIFFTKYILNPILIERVVNDGFIVLLFRTGQSDSEVVNPPYLQPMTNTQIRLLILFLAGFFYFVFRLYLHGWSLDVYSWAVLYSNRVLFADHVFIGDPNKLFEALVGLLPAYFDKPILFPLISAAFGSAICLAVYELILLLVRHKGYALAAWGVLLLAPVLYWQVLSCNSILYATCFAVGSLYFFTSGKTTTGSILLSCAALSRPEPFILIVLASAYLLFQWKKREITFRRLYGTLAVLAVPPAIWLVANFYQTDNAIYAFQLAQDYTKSTHQNIDAAEFPKRLWFLLTAFYYNPIALAFCAVGFIVLAKRFRSLLFVYGYTLLSIGGYWVLAPYNIPLLERYVLPISIYLLVFGVLLFHELEARWLRPIGLPRTDFLKSALLSIIFLLVFIHLPAHHVANQIINYHKSFDQDVPIVADHIRQKLAETDSGKLRILMSARRQAHYDYLLYEDRSRLTFIYFRKLYYEKMDLRKSKIDYAFYSPNDLYPLKSAFYTFDMLSDEGLKKQNMRVGETISISENTKILQFLR